MNDTPTPRTNAERLLIMCNYHYKITEEDKDFLALLSEKIEDNTVLFATRDTPTPITDELEFEVIDDFEYGIKVVKSTNVRQLERELTAVTEQLTMERDNYKSWLQVANEKAEQLTEQRDRLAEALNVYLKAGHKEARRYASVLAKEAIQSLNQPEQ